MAKKSPRSSSSDRSNDGGRKRRSKRPPKGAPAFGTLRGRSRRPKSLRDLVKDLDLDGEGTTSEEDSIETARDLFSRGMTGRSRGGLLNNITNPLHPGRSSFVQTLRDRPCHKRMKSTMPRTLTTRPGHARGRSVDSHGSHLEYAAQQQLPLDRTVRAPIRGPDGERVKEWLYELVKDQQPFKQMYYATGTEGEHKYRAVKDVVGNMYRIFVPANWQLIQRGESDKTVYVVERGTMSVEIEALKKARAKDLIKGRGDILGEFALMMDCDRTATVVAKTRCFVWVATYGMFEEYWHSLGHLKRSPPKFAIQPTKRISKLSEVSTFVYDDDQIREVFNKIDDDNSGEMDQKEFGAAIQLLLGEKEAMNLNVKELFLELDEDGGGTICYDEFAQFVRTHELGKTLMKNSQMLDKFHYGLFVYRLKVRLWYDKAWVQSAFGMLIVLNFGISALQYTTWAMPNGDIQYAFDLCDLIFLQAFTIELILNLFGNWWTRFWTSSWNWFDFIVITTTWVVNMAVGIHLGMADEGELEKEGVDLSWLRVVRVMRVIRVFRIVGKFRMLRVLVQTVSASIPAVVAVLVLFFILLVSYSIMGVLFFQDFVLPDCVDQPGQDYCASFGSLLNGMLTMFQLTTLEGWVDTAMPLRRYNQWSVIFVISYVSSTYYLLMNMLVAIFIRKMNEAQMIINEEDRQNTQIKIHRRLVLERTVAKLNNIRDDYDQEEAAERVESIKHQLKRIDEIQVDKDKIERRDEQTATQEIITQLSSLLEAEVASRIEAVEGNVDLLMRNVNFMRNVFIRIADKLDIDIDDIGTQESSYEDDIALTEKNRTATQRRRSDDEDKGESRRSVAEWGRKQTTVVKLTGEASEQSTSKIIPDAKPVESESRSSTTKDEQAGTIVGRTSL